MTGLASTPPRGTARIEGLRHTGDSSERPVAAEAGEDEGGEAQAGPPAQATMGSAGAGVVRAGVVVAVPAGAVVHQSLDAAQAGAVVHAALRRTQTKVVTQPETGHRPGFPTRVASTPSALATDDATVTVGGRSRRGTSPRRVLLERLSRLLGHHYLSIPVPFHSRRTTSPSVTRGRRS